MHKTLRGFGLTSCTLVIMLATGIFPVSADTQSPVKTEPKTGDFSLAISGGLSLGAYEAGLNWTIINYQKHTHSQLRSVTGASAGGVNALLSAINWCLDEDRMLSQAAAIDQVMGNRQGRYGSVDNNLLREVWLHAGFDSLLPPKPEAQSYMKEDALLSRYAYKNAIGKIILLSRLKIFKNCNIPMGLVVTRVEPLALKIKNVQINSSRMVIPLLIRTKPDHSLGFYSLIVPEKEKRFGSVIYLPSLEEQVVKLNTRSVQSYPIGVKSLLTAVLTSSAFPVAFGRINLAHCQSSHYGDLNVVLDGETNSKALNAFQMEELGDKRYFCPQGTHLLKTEFVDGGAFDNLPVGLSIHLNRIQSNKAEQIHYYYMDPNNIRPEGKKDRSHSSLNFANSAQALSFDLMEQLRFFVGSSKASSDYELYNSFRWDPIPTENLFLSTRYGPLTGKYWAHLGAFIDFAFREYDYYVGVYDGLHMLAEQICSKTKSKTSRQRCLIEQIVKNQHKLNQQNSEKMTFMVHLLLQYEFGETLKVLPQTSSTLFQEQCHSPDNPCKLSASTLGQLNKLNRIHKSLTRPSKKTMKSKGSDSKTNTSRQPQFSRFIRDLEADAYPRQNNETTLNYILDNVKRDRLNWYQPLINRASHRLVQLENSGLYLKADKNIDETSSLASLRAENNNGIYDILKPAAKLGVYFAAVSANTLVGTNDSFSFTQSSAPHPGLWALLPYEIGVDFRNGGTVMAWEPSWNIAGRHYINLRLMPYDNNRFGDHDIYTSQMDFIYKVRTGFGISSVGLAPTWTRTYKDWGGQTRRDNLGAALHIGLMAEKLRLSIGTRAFKDEYYPGNSFYITVSLTDIPGMSYWFKKTYFAQAPVYDDSKTFFPK